MAGIQLSLSGERELARDRLEFLWSTLHPNDFFHRCILAHYLADLQTTPGEELSWDLLALRAALDAVPSDFDNRIPDVSLEGFLPSLYLNVAASYERVGDTGAARQHVALARTHVHALKESALADMTRAAIERIGARLTTP